jgi:hypothetical protein
LYGCPGVGRCRQPYILARDAEARVEDLYRKIQLPPSWASRLTEELDAEIVERQAEASERRVVLTRTEHLPPSTAGDSGLSW